VLPELLTRIKTLEEAVQLILDDDYLAQEKRDGERLLVRRREPQVEGWNKRGHPTEVSSRLKSDLLSVNVELFVLDGEYERSIYCCWDLLQVEALDLRSLPYQYRYHVLKPFAACPFLNILPVWAGRQDKREAIAQFLQRGAEGVVFKNRNATYRSGRAGQHYKLPFEKKATARIRTVHPTKASAELEMLEENGRWLPVSGVKIERGLVKPGDYVEVRFSTASTNKRLVQPVFLRKRTDCCDLDCSVQQLDYSGRWSPNNLLAEL